jgi:hypothetical protein
MLTGHRGGALEEGRLMWSRKETLPALVELVHAAMYYMVTMHGASRISDYSTSKQASMHVL